MEERSFSEQYADDFILPGFRFHPTDEELVEFYLKMKLQNRALPIELIKAVDIYKYDPWELPKLNSSSAEKEKEREKEKEWYFYCPRDRKYRNSTRPNRVTGSGFWKATGTDRPIYSSGGGSQCVGLKKSLVFYRGRAAKGFKTDWMMHEFRLPSDKSFPLTDSWAICRIFKKTNSTANRDLSHNWTQTTSSDVFAYFPGNLVFSEASGTSHNHPTSTYFNQSLPANNNFEDHHYQTNYSFDSSQVIQATIHGEDDQRGLWENIRSMAGFPFSSPPCPSEMSSTTFGL